jgi:hypothetical protein
VELSSVKPFKFIHGGVASLIRRSRLTAVWSAPSTVGAGDRFDISAARGMTAEVEAAVSRGTEMLMQDVEAA